MRASQLGQQSLKLLSLKQQRFQRHGRQKHSYLRGFLHFRAKTSSLGNVQNHCKNHCFCPTNTAKTVTQTAPKSQNLAPRPPDKTHEKKRISKPKIEDQKLKRHVLLFHFSLAGSGWAHARTSPFRAVKTVFFEVRRRDLSKTNCFHQKMPHPQVNLYLTVVYAIRMITP